MDTLGWPITTKIAEVGTWQLVRVLIIPAVRAGVITFEESIAFAAAETTEKGGQAKTEHLEKLRKQVKEAFINKLNDYVRDLDSSLPRSIRGVPIVSRIRIATRLASDPPKARRELMHALPAEIRRDNLSSLIRLDVGPYADNDVDAELVLQPGAIFTSAATIEEGGAPPQRPLYLWGDTCQGAGPGRRQFYMSSVDLGSSIRGVVPFTGNCCDNFIFVVQDGAGTKGFAPATPEQMRGGDEMQKGFNDHVGGQDHQKQTEIALRPDEYIVGYQIHFGSKTDSVRFLLSSGRAVGMPSAGAGEPGLLVGGPGGHKSSPVYRAPSGYGLVGLKVNGAGDTVDSIRGLFRRRIP